MMKSFSKTQVILTFQCSHPWPDGLWGLLDLWARYEDIGLAPERYGSAEMRTFLITAWDKVKMEQTWERASGGIFKRKRPWNMVGQVLSNWNRYTRQPIRTLSFFDLWLDQDFFADEQRVGRFLELCRDIYTWGHMDHGYVACDTEYEQKNSITPGGMRGGPNLEYALPGIYWANFFGPTYVHWLGEEKFESLETFYKERLADGGWLLLTRPSVLEYQDPALRVHEAGIIHYLGRHAFFELEDPWKPTYRPDFWGESGSPNGSMPGRTLRLYSRPK